MLWANFYLPHFIDLIKCWPFKVQKYVFSAIKRLVGGSINAIRKSRDSVVKNVLLISVSHVVSLKNIYYTVKQGEKAQHELENSK